MCSLQVLKMPTTPSTWTHAPNSSVGSLSHEMQTTVPLHTCSNSCLMLALYASKLLRMLVFNLHSMSRGNPGCKNATNVVGDHTPRRKHATVGDGGMPNTFLFVRTEETRVQMPCLYGPLGCSCTQLALPLLILTEHVHMKVMLHAKHHLPDKQHCPLVSLVHDDVCDFPEHTFPAIVMCTPVANR